MSQNVVLIAEEIGTSSRTTLDYETEVIPILKRYGIEDHFRRYIVMGSDCYQRGYTKHGMWTVSSRHSTTIVQRFSVDPLSAIKRLLGLKKEVSESELWFKNLVRNFREGNYKPEQTLVVVDSSQLDHLQTVPEDLGIETSVYRQ